MKARDWQTNVANQLFNLAQKIDWKHELCVERRSHPCGIMEYVVVLNKANVALLSVEVSLFRGEPSDNMNIKIRAGGYQHTFDSTEQGVKSARVSFDEILSGMLAE